MKYKIAFQYLSVFSILYLIIGDSIIKPLIFADVGPAWWTLDNSWQLAVNYAFQKGWSFGDEFIFTYGPLGFLATRVGLGLGKLPYLLFDLFFIVNVGFIIHYYLTKWWNIKAYIAILVSILCIGRLYDANIVFVLLLISLFWMNYAVEQYEKFAFIPSGIIVVLLFYIKINLSFIALFVLYLYLAFYFVFNQRDKKWILLFTGLVPISIIIIGLMLHVNLWGYVISGLNIINSYNDAMYTPISSDKYHWLILAGLMFIAFVAMQVYNVINDKFKDKFSILLLLSTSLIGFVLFKQGFVRADTTHMLDFFYMMPILIGSTCAFFKYKESLKYIIPPVCSICFVIIISEGGIDFNQRFRGPLKYLSEIFKPINPDLLSYQSQAYKKYIPANIKSLIGNGSIDIIPWDISCLYLNQFNYSPRPVFQSYNPYNYYLMNLNKEKYEGKSGPDFVLVSNDAIDNRYPLFDDQEMKISLIKNYKAIEIFKLNDKYYLLLKKDIAKSDFTNKLVEKRKILIGQSYSIQDPSKSYLIKFDINYSFIGKLIRLVYQPYEIKIEFLFEDASTVEHRAILPIVKNGVIINPYISDEIDLYNFINRDSFQAGKSVKKVRIKTESLFAYSNDINLEVFECEIRNRKKHIQTQQIVSDIKVNSNLTGWIDNMNIKEGCFYIDGWASIANMSSENSQIFAYLKSDKISYKIQLKKRERKDVTAYHKNSSNLDESGFYEVVNTSELEKGSYEVGILVEKENSKYSGLEYFDNKKVEIK